MKQIKTKLQKSNLLAIFEYGNQKFYAKVKQKKYRERGENHTKISNLLKVVPYLKQNWFWDLHHPD